MDKLPLLTDSTSSKPYYTDTKCQFEDFIIIQDYLLIKLVNPKLEVFKLNKAKSSAEFNRAISLSNKNTVKSIEAINPKNVFLIYHTSEVLVVDIIKGTQAEVALIASDTSIQLKASSVSIHECIELHNTSDTNSSLYIGFISVKNDFYLSYKDSDPSKYSFTCISITQFNNDIIHIEYKLFDYKQTTYCFICVLCKQEGYCNLIEMNKDKNVQSFVSLLSNNWIRIFKEEKIIDYRYSFYFNSSNMSTSCFVILTDQNKLLYWTFNGSFSNIDSLITKGDDSVPLAMKHQRNDTKMKDICNYSTTVYLCYANEIIEVKCSNTDEVLHSIKNISALTKAILYHMDNKFYLIGMTVNEMLIMAAKGEQSQSSINLNLTLGVNENKESLLAKKDDSIPLQQLPTEEKKKINFQLDNTHPPQQGQSQPNNLNSHSNTAKRYICSTCDSTALYRCDHCKLFFSCDQNKHKEEWLVHYNTCPKYTKPKEKEIEVIAYEPRWDLQRKDIVILMNKKDHASAISKAYAMIQQNIKLINDLRDKRRLCPFDSNELSIKYNRRDMINTFLYYEDYFCNILLLIHAFSRFKSKDDVWRLLNRLVREMETYHINEGMEAICEEFRKAMKSNDDNDIKELEEIYLRILKIIIAISKFAFTLGEFTFYEEFLLDYVLKIQKVYNDNLYIIYNTYLLLGNLYVEFGSLKKGSTLYDAIINNNNMAISPKLYDTVLCANYNSGLIHFVRDNYEMAKQRLDTALKIKKEIMKERNDLQISIIYETLAETDIEYKHFSSAYFNLQNAIEARELSNTVTPEFKLKAQVLKDYITQNATDTKASLNPNFQLSVSKNTEEEDTEKLIQNILSDCQVLVDKSPDINELEKFFLFMTKLSNDQIRKLNMGQPMNPEKNKFFPIVFSMEFKSSLNHNQRLALCDLKMTSLTRINVLKNYLGNITIKNLNYNALNLVPPENNLNSIRNLYVTKKIMKNWEVTEEHNDSNSDEEGDRFDSDSLRMPGEHKETVNFMLNKKRPMPKGKKKDVKVVIVDETVNEHSVSNEENKPIDYSAVKQKIKEYCIANAPEKEKYIDDKFLFLISREMDVNELKEIVANPEMIDVLIDTYIEMGQCTSRGIEGEVSNKKTITYDNEEVINNNDNGSDIDTIGNGNGIGYTDRNDNDKDIDDSDSGNDNDNDNDYGDMNLDLKDNREVLKEFLKEDSESSRKDKNIPIPPQFPDFFLK